MAVAERDVSAAAMAWREVAAAALRPGDRIACGEYVREGEAKRLRLLPRKVVAVRRVDDLILYRTDGPHAARHVRTPGAPLRRLNGQSLGERMADVRRSSSGFFHTGRVRGG